MFSKPQKEIKPLTDKDVLHLIGEIEFRFGKKKHKVKDITILFVHEIAVDVFGTHVIAFSVEFGAICFTIPHDLADKISARIYKTIYPVKEYISLLFEFREMIENGAATLDSPTIVEALRAIAKAAAQVNGCDYAGDSLVTLAKEVKTEANKPIDRRIRSNNWLKYHGLPMRRKGKGRKKK